MTHFSSFFSLSLYLYPIFLRFSRHRFSPFSIVRSYILVRDCGFSSAKNAPSLVANAGKNPNVVSAPNEHALNERRPFKPARYINFNVLSSQRRDVAEFRECVLIVDRSRSVSLQFRSFTLFNVITRQIPLRPRDTFMSDSIGAADSPV